MPRIAKYQYRTDYIYEYRTKFGGTWKITVPDQDDHLAVRMIREKHTDEYVKGSLKLVDKKRIRI